MILTVSKILQIKSALKELENKELPSKLSYWLGRLEDKITPILDRYSKEHNRLIMEKYGVKDEFGVFSVPSDKLEEFVKEITEIQSQQEDITITIKLELFDEVKISKEFFIALGDIVQE